MSDPSIFDSNSEYHFAGVGKMIVKNRTNNE
jgi:hypothetical protein